MMNEKLKQRLEEKIERIPECGCWLWLGGVQSKGYGRIYISSKKAILTHRLSWEIHNGKIPKHMNVLHSCDTPLCVNPYHLFLGTLADNNKDMVKKGRNRFVIGEKNGRSKLLEHQVIDIRKDNRPIKTIACEYNVSQGNVLAIKSLASWKHL